jgi:hypothetical protein
MDEGRSFRYQVSDTKPISRQQPAERLSFLHYCVLVGQSKLSGEALALLCYLLVYFTLLLTGVFYSVTYWCVLRKADRTGEAACKIRSPQCQWLYRRRVRGVGCRNRTLTSFVSNSNGVKKSEPMKL